MTGPSPHHAAAQQVLLADTGYDALAELFLGSPAADNDERADDSSKTRSIPAISEPQPARAPQPRLAAPTPGVEIELLLAGHLPIHGSPWPAQYARAVSEQIARPVAMLRLRQHQCSVELFGAAPISPADSPGPVTDLPGAIRAAGAANRWIVLCDESEAHRLARIGGVTHATLLSGANEAAVVAAYRSVKSLACPTSGETPASLRLGVAVVGASDEDANTVVERIAEACSAFLGRNVELAGVVSKLKPTGAVVLFRGSTDLSLEHAAKLILQPAPAAQPAPKTRTDHPRATTSVCSETAVVPPTAAAPNASSAPIEHHAPEPTLYRHIAGLVPLAVRCPEDHSVELAGDREGSLHVLISTAANAERAVERLVAVTAWAKRHLDLIAMAAANVMPLDTRRPPIAHVFTPTPKAVRHLLDAEVKIHALAPVTIDQRTAWCCLELN